MPPDLSWLPKVRHLLGAVADDEVALRAGVSQSMVTKARQALGIPSRRFRSLASYSPGKVLDLVRARAKAGLPMRGRPDGDHRLASLCRYHFGGWYQAVAAAGLKPEGRPVAPTARPTKPRPLTERELRSSASAADLERQTGVSRDVIKSKRKALGIQRDERRPMDQSWVPAARPLLGKVPDRKIAERFGVPASSVTTTRQRLGIPGGHNPARVDGTAIRERLAGLSKAELRRLLAGLDPINAAIVRERLLADRPATQDQLAARFGVTRQAVAQREARLGA